MTAGVERFLELHRGETPLLMPNPWDAGSARVLESLGFEALATTSSGHAATLGRIDGRVTREEALAHAAEIVGAVGVPVSADLENCFADDPEGVADTVRGAIEAGLAGCSVEDYSGAETDEIYEFDLAVARVAAAAEAAAGRIAITARAENFIRDRPDLGDTIARLQAFQEAGADVLFAPNVYKPDDLRQVVAAVDLPFNIVARPGMPSLDELAEIGVARVSVGGAFTFAALGSLVEAAEELRSGRLEGFWGRMGRGSAAARGAFS